MMTAEEAREKSIEGHNKCTIDAAIAQKAAIQRHLGFIEDEIYQAVNNGEREVFIVVPYEHYRPIYEHLLGKGYRIVPDRDHRKLLNIFRGRERWEFDLIPFEGDIYFDIKW